MVAVTSQRHTLPSKSPAYTASMVPSEPSSTKALANANPALLDGDPVFVETFSSKAPVFGFRMKK